MRQFYRFYVRDLFWLMIVAALLICWSLDHRDLKRKNESLADENLKVNFEAIKNLVRSTLVSSTGELGQYAQPTREQN